MPSKLPHYALRTPAPIMDKLKYIALYHGRSANKEIEQLIIKHIGTFETEHGAIDPQQIAEVPVVRRS